MANEKYSDGPHPLHRHPVLVTGIQRGALVLRPPTESVHKPAL